MQGSRHSRKRRFGTMLFFRSVKVAAPHRNKTSVSRSISRISIVVFTRADEIDQIIAKLAAYQSFIVQAAVKNAGCLAAQRKNGNAADVFIILRSFADYAQRIDIQIKGFLYHLLQTNLSKYCLHCS